MSALHGLREWVTLPEAAAYLARDLSEPVSEADVVRLGLDSMLQLSVYLVNNAMARVGALPNGEFLVDDFDQLTISWHNDQPEVIGGVWDLILVGSGAIELEKRFQHLTNGPDVTLWTVGGLYLARPDRSQWAELVTVEIHDVKVFADVVVNGLPMVKIEKRYPSLREVPKDAVIVARIEALDRLLSALRSDVSHIVGEVVGTPARHVPRQRAQELAILAALRARGVDPLAIPAALPGKRSAWKQAVQEALSYSPEIMKKALKRLRSSGEIKDA